MIASSYSRSKAEQTVNDSEMSSRPAFTTSDYSDGHSSPLGFLFSFLFSILDVKWMYLWRRWIALGWELMDEDILVKVQFGTACNLQYFKIPDKDLDKKHSKQPWATASSNKKSITRDEHTSQAKSNSTAIWSQLVSFAIMNWTSIFTRVQLWYNRIVLPCDMQI